MRTFSQVVALLAVMLFAGAAFAARDKAAGEAKSAREPALRGEVVKVDGANLVVKTKTQERTVATDANTQVVVEGAPAKLADLKAGQKVTVTPPKGTATKIEVGKPKTPKAPKQKN